jgi:hypothetical protein
LDAPCFAAWQVAHAQGGWETLATRWPELRATFVARSSPAWPAFGSLDERSALARTTDALGAARIAYRLRDMDTYAHAAHVFARALVQLVAEQRGINYFREHQPWRSMEPLSASAALAGLTTNGWVAGPASMETFAGVPDIARLLRDAQPPAAGQPPGPGAKRERLIPGGRATPFLANRDSESNAFSGLVHSIECGNTGGWPRMVWTAPQPGSDTGWNFGAIMTTRSAAVKSEVLHLDANTRVTVVRRQ